MISIQKMIIIQKIYRIYKIEINKFLKILKIVLT